MQVVDQVARMPEILGLTFSHLHDLQFTEWSPMMWHAASVEIEYAHDVWTMLKMKSLSFVEQTKPRYVKKWVHQKDCAYLLTRRAREIVCTLWYIHFRIRLCSIMIWDDVSRRIKMIVLHQEWCDNVFTSQGEWFLLPPEEIWQLSRSRILSVGHHFENRVSRVKICS